MLHHAMWVHGHSMQVEHPDRLNLLQRTSSYVEVEGELGTDNWFHFAIPTPVMVTGDRLRVGSVLIRFRTGSSGAFIHAVRVYDGETQITLHDGLHLISPRPVYHHPADQTRLWGDWQTERFDVPDNPEILWGLGISIGVRFGTARGTVAQHMQFSAAGCDFVL